VVIGVCLSRPSRVWAAEFGFRALAVKYKHGKRREKRARNAAMRAARSSTRTPEDIMSAAGIDAGLEPARGAPDDISRRSKACRRHRFCGGLSFCCRSAAGSKSMTCSSPAISRRASTAADY
jgi:hypothetical protein